MKTSSTDQAGGTIVIVISIMATLAVVVAIAAEYTSTVSRHVQRSNTLQSAFAIADGCIENSFAQWRKISRSKQKPIPTTNDLTAISLLGSTQFPNVDNFTITAGVENPAYTVSNCKVIAVDPQLNPMGADVAPTAGVGQQADAVTYNYLATAVVNLPTPQGRVTARVQRVLQQQQLSPWNYAIFYHDPLEIHPGAPFTITGWVHTNSDLYTGHDLLTFADKVTFVGDWFKASKNPKPGEGFKKGESRSATGSSPEKPTLPNWPSDLEPTKDIAHEPFGIDSSTMDYHDLIEPRPTGMTYANDALADMRYRDQAGVIVEIASNGSITYKIPKGDGTGNDRTISGSSSGTDKAIYNMVSSAMTSVSQITLQDNRETTSSVRVTTLDVSKLVNRTAGGWNASKGSYNYVVPSFNGIVYINDTSAASNGIGTKRGIRLKNGSTIPAGGLTVASPNPVYIHGDYNTGWNAPPSNSGNADDADTPQGSGYTRQPCSVVADAVNILSNAWNNVPNSTASNTTVNSAIVSGIVPTGANGESYSGGAENFPRFLENWSGKTFTYYGSMVELYKSQQAIGKWGKDNVYSAPNRRWFFDDIFKISTPPGTLMVYTYVKGRWSVY